MSITVDTAWTAIAAAQALAQAHGLELDPHLAPERLRLDFKRGPTVTCWVVLSALALEACGDDQAAVKAFVEHEVATLLRLRHGAVRA